MLFSFVFLALLALAAPATVAQEQPGYVDYQSQIYPPLPPPPGAPDVHFTPTLEVVIREEGSTLWYDYWLVNPEDSRFDVYSARFYPLFPLRGMDHRYSPPFVVGHNPWKPEPWEPLRPGTEWAFFRLFHFFANDPEGLRHNKGKRFLVASLECPATGLAPGPQPPAVVLVRINADLNQVDEYKWQLSDEVSIRETGKPCERPPEGAEAGEWYCIDDQLQDWLEWQATMPARLTLGPLPVRVASWEHWERFRHDLDFAKRDLNWFPDEALFSQLRALVEQAHEAAVARNGNRVNELLQEVESRANAASESQLSREGRWLFAYNARALRQELPIPCEPVMELKPLSAFYPMGEKAKVEVKLYNRANGQPLVGEEVRWRFDPGPEAGGRFRSFHQGEMSAITDAQGLATFWVDSPPYTPPTPFGPPPERSRATDHFFVEAGQEGYLRGKAASAPKQGEPCVLSQVLRLDGSIVWDAAVRKPGPNLVATVTWPPGGAVLSGPGGEVLFQEVTTNTGTAPAPSSLTRYYVSHTNIPDPSQGVPLGEREVGALGPGESSESQQTTLVLPTGVRPGWLYLFACADVRSEVEETDETDNCAMVAQFQPVPGVVRMLELEGQLPVGVVAQGYSGEVRAKSGWGPYQFVLTAGSLPPGLAMDSQGRITGTPTREGQYHFQVKATDARGVAGQSEFSIMVTQQMGGPVPAFTPWGLLLAASLILLLGSVLAWRYRHAPSR